MPLLQGLSFQQASPEYRVRHSLLLGHGPTLLIHVGEIKTLNTPPCVRCDIKLESNTYKDHILENIYLFYR